MAAQGRATIEGASPNFSYSCTSGTGPLPLWERPVLSAVEGVRVRGPLTGLVPRKTLTPVLLGDEAGPVVEGCMPLADGDPRGDCSGHEGLGRGYCLSHLLPLGQASGDGSGKGAPGTVGADRGQLGGGIVAKRAPVEQQVAGFLRQVSTLDHNVSRTEGFNATGRFFHPRPVVVLYTLQ
jgi:hypothetical protein